MLPKTHFAVLLAPALFLVHCSDDPTEPGNDAGSSSGTGASSSSSSGGSSSGGSSSSSSSSGGSSSGGSSSGGSSSGGSSSSGDNDAGTDASADAAVLGPDGGECNSTVKIGQTTCTKLGVECGPICGGEYDCGGCLNGSCDANGHCGTGNTDQ